MMTTIRPNVRPNIRRLTSRQTIRQWRWDVLTLWILAGTINALLWAGFFYLITR